MAYGVKYSLTFADIRGIKKKIEILKKNYTGAVLPMVCSGNPVVIEWKADDDIYSPLVGSSCTINLMVTDSVSYDQFFDYDEREYQVKIYFESNTDTYALYWQGYLTNDMYAEAMTTTPYSFSIKAIDGLGTLNAFDSWMPDTGVYEATLWEFIWHNLTYLDLGFDIWISNDIRYFDQPSWKNVFVDATVNKSTYFHKSYVIDNAKDVLKSILLGFNCKIFQAYGRWVIVNSSSYGDQRIIEGVQAGTYTGSGILTAKQGFLNGGSENIKFYIYNSSGVETGNITDSFLRIAPDYFALVGNNLVRKLDRPVKKYQEIVDISQKNLDLNENASFEFALNEGWSMPYGNGIVDNNPFAGKRAFVFSEYTQILGSYTRKLYSNNVANAVKGEQYQVLISVNLNEASGGANGARLPWYMRVFSSGNYYYWSEVNKGWGNSPTILWNEFRLDAKGEWETLKATAGALTVDGTIDIGFGVPYIDASGSFIDTHVDNFAVRNIDKEQNQYKEVMFIREQTSTQVRTDVMEHDGVKQANIGDGIFWGQFKNQPKFKRCNDTTPKSIEEIVTQQRLNDFRTYSKSYEGTLYGNYGYLVMTLQNKIYFSWNNFQESDSAIIDSMKYNVKENTYDVICHVPNNYTDVASTFRVSYQE